MHVAENVLSIAGTRPPNGRRSQREQTRIVPRTRSGLRKLRAGLVCRAAAMMSCHSPGRRGGRTGPNGLRGRRPAPRIEDPSEKLRQEVACLTGDTPKRKGCQVPAGRVAECRCRAELKGSRARQAPTRSGQDDAFVRALGMIVAA